MDDVLVKQFQKREAWRKRKKLIIAIFPSILFILIIGLIIILSQPAPTCFDGKENGEETGIDCGGSCVACGVKYASPLEVISSDILGIGQNASELTIKVRNSNADYGAQFSYQINVISLLGEKVSEASGESFVLPHSDKYLIEPKVPFKAADLSRAEVIITKTEWFSLNKSSNDLFDIYDRKARILEAAQSGYLEVSGKIANKISHDFSTVDLTFIVYSKTGRLLYAAKTEISNLKANDIKDFVYNGFPYFANFQEVDLDRIEFLAEAWPN
ncbi:MAG TPA: hypothetical protein P5524_00610 [Candidatus Paceibacterota bacterium]|nr:hypothetical protein [Candidatus Paceibacterota bacterium]